MFRVYSCVLAVVLLVIAVRSVDSIKCKACSSIDSFGCASQPDSIKNTCEGDKCYTYIDGKLTKRDCNGPSNANCTADFCKECEKDECNTVIIPENRKLCFQCNGMKDCGTTSSQTALACQNYVADDECYTYVADDQTVVRGCTSDESEKCTANKDFCVSCDTSNCNNLEAIAQKKCFNCTSVEDKLCKRPQTVEGNCTMPGSTKTCNVDVLLGRTPQCYNYLDGEIVTRGCGKGNDPSNKVCDGEMCNKDCYLDTSCHVCGADKCKSDNIGDSTKCGDFISSCNHCETLDGKSTIRGCGGPDPKDYICKSCVGENCNNVAKLPRMCYICDSKTNPNCAKNVGIDSKFCDDFSKQCMVKLGVDGVTTRSCAAESECPSNSTDCKICNEHYCNTQVLVQDQTKCFTCSDAENCAKDQLTTGVNATECSNQGDQCYMFSKDDKQMQRGCISDPKRPEECIKGDAKCALCNRDGCNSAPLVGSSGLQCVQCKTNDTACPWRYKADSSTDCSTNLFYYQQELCYTLKHPGNKVERGCLSETKDCTLENKNCRVCYDSGCNTQSTMSFSCIQCRSDVYGQAACEKENPAIAKSECSMDPTEETRGCYIENYGGIIIRGCLSDLDTMQFTECRDPKMLRCFSCPDENCNVQKPPNSSSAPRVSAFLVACVMFLSFRGFKVML